MQVDTWPKSADHLVEVAGLCLAATHVIFVVLIVLWFGLKKPTSLALFRTRLSAAMHRKPLPPDLRSSWRPRG